MGEILVVLVIVVILFGANKLPQLGKGLGEAIRNFKKGMADEKPPPRAPEPGALPPGEARSGAGEGGAAEPAKPTAAPAKPAGGAGPGE